MQCVRDRYPALFSPAKNTMQLFMWQRDIVRVTHYIMDSFQVLGAPDDAPDDASISSSSALGWEDAFIHSLASYSAVSCPLCLR